jgi:hypothetical protein
MQIRSFVKRKMNGCRDILGEGVVGGAGGEAERRDPGEFQNKLNHMAPDYVHE